MVAQDQPVAARIAALKADLERAEWESAAPGAAPPLVDPEAIRREIARLAYYSERNIEFEPDF